MIQVDENGRRYVAGKNGKRWPFPPAVMYHDDALAISMSIVFYGHQPLTELEHKIYELVLPILAGMQESVEQQFEEPTSFAGGHPTVSLDAEDLAYSIAEEIAAAGFVQAPQPVP